MALRRGGLLAVESSSSVTVQTTAVRQPWFSTPSDRACECRSFHPPHFPGTQNHNRKYLLPHLGLVHYTSFGDFSPFFAVAFCASWPLHFVVQKNFISIRPRDRRIAARPYYEFERCTTKASRRLGRRRAEALRN